MAKEFENKFFQDLEGSVIKEEPVLETKDDKLSDLIARKEQLQKTLEEMKANVIVDPKAVKKIEKEIKELEKAIESGNMETPEEVEANTDKEAKEEEKEKVQEAETKVTKEQDEEAIVDKEKQVVEEQNRSDIVKEQYYEALMALYEHRIGSIELAKKQGALITTRDSFEKEMLLEAEMYRLRDEYMAMGYDDPFKEKRTELIKQEKDAKEPIELVLREKARKFRLLQQELVRMDEEEREIHEELLNPDISSGKIEELNSRLDELGEKRKQVQLQLADIRKDLEPTIEERKERAYERANLEDKHFETLTQEDKENYAYQQQKVRTMNANTEKAITQEYRNLKLRIEEREYHIKELSRELDRTPATDFERRLELLDKMDKETSMLEADRESKRDLDLGIKPDENKRKKEVIEDNEKEEDRKKEFEKDTREVKAIIEEQKDKQGERVIANPVAETVKDNDREEESKATMAAVVVDDVKETESTVKKYAIAETAIEGLDEIQDVDDPEAAKAYLEQDTELGEAARELKEKQEEIEQKIER